MTTTTKYEWRLWQDDMCVASGEAKTLETTRTEGRHYLSQYAQDGPSKLEILYVTESVVEVKNAGGN